MARRDDEYSDGKVGRGEHGSTVVANDFFAPVVEEKPRLQGEDIRYLNELGFYANTGVVEGGEIRPRHGEDVDVGRLENIANKLAPNGSKAILVSAEHEDVRITDGGLINAMVSQGVMIDNSHMLPCLSRENRKHQKLAPLFDGPKKGGPRI